MKNNVIQKRVEKRIEDASFYRYREFSFILFSFFSFSRRDEMKKEILKNFFLRAIERGSCFFINRFFFFEKIFYSFPFSIRLETRDGTGFAEKEKIQIVIVTLIK